MKSIILKSDEVTTLQADGKVAISRAIKRLKLHSDYGEPNWDRAWIDNSYDPPCLKVEYSGLCRGIPDPTIHRHWSPYEPGDRLWVRETIRYNQEAQNYYYAADSKGVGIKRYAQIRALSDQPKKVITSIHMPKWACRLWLEVKSVRAERLQEISDADAIAEGIELHEKREHYSDNSYRVYLANTSHLEKPCDGPGYYYRTGGPTTCFRMLWDSINAKRGYGWESNPWVWVVEFERIEP